MTHDIRSSGELSRRSMLKIGAAGCTGAVIATSIAPNPFASKQDFCGRWQTAIDQDFQFIKKSFIENESFRPVKLRLVEVDQQKTKTQDGKALPGQIPEHSISLRFEASKRMQLDTATYRIKHPEIGECNLFVSEILSHPDSKVRSFEAVIG